MLGCSVSVSGAITTATAAPRPATASVGAVANVVIYSINSDGAYFQAIVNRAIGDHGPAVTVHPDGKVDPEHTSELELELKHGSFRREIAGLAEKFRQSTGHEPMYASTCSDFVRVTGSLPIVTGSGTGLYKGITGSFAATLTGDEVQATPCTQSDQLVRQILLLTGSGTVSF